MKRVLIVDDSGLILAQLTDILIESGFAVVGEARSGKEAVRKAKKLRPDIILMDIIMPGPMDGIKAANRIHEELDIPVVFLTGHEDDGLIADAKETGADGYLLKPVNPSELKATMEISLYRRDSEKELNRFYREVIENTNDMIYVVDGYGKMKFVNNRILAFAGFDRKEDVIGKSFASFITPRSLAWAAEKFERQRKGEDVGPFELELVDRDGGVNAVEIRERVVWKEGRIVEFHGIGRDLGERRKAQEALKASEERYRGLFANSIEAAFTADLKGNFTEVNSAFEAICGYSRDELIGLNYRQLMDRENAEKVFQAYHNLYLSREPNRDLAYDFIKKDGEKRTVEAYISNLYEGNEVVGFQGTFRDITEKKKIQEALVQSEAKYRELIENAVDLIFLTDIEGYFLEVNESLLRDTGYSQDEILSRNFQDFLYPDDVGIALTAYEKGRSGQPFAFEMRAKRKDGSFGWYSFSIRPVPDSTGKPLHIHGIARDITEKKRAEEALRVSEEKYRRFIENAQESIAVITDTVFQYANPMTEKLTGYSLKELRKKTFIDLIHPEDRDVVTKEYLRKMSGDAVTYPTEFRYITRDGEIRWFEGIAVSVPWEGKPAILYFARDFTERKQAEDAVREFEEKWRSFIETSRDIIFITDVDGTMIDINPACEEISGYRREELVGKSILSIYADPNDRERIFRKVIEDGAIKDLEVDLIKKDGSIAHFLMTANQRKDASGNFVGLQGTLKDITERKKLQEQVIRTQKMEAVVSLAGGIAHNFNNILTGIMGYSEYLISQKMKDDPDYKALETIHQGTIRAAELTRQLLNSARTGQFSPVPVSLNDVVRKAFPLITGTFDKSIEISTHLDKHLMLIEGDYGQLEQSLLNLCINARDAMPTGGKLIIETSHQKVDKDFMKTHLGTVEGNYVVLSVTDTGIGIAPEIEEHIFEPFFTTKEKSGGSGLGLATVYGIVRNHNGQITVYSEMGKGTTFKLYFPATDRGAEEISTATKIADTKGKGTILIIDDEPVVRDMWGDFLTQRGYDVLAAEDGQMGIDVFRDHPSDIDLILLDLVMPRVGGMETLRLLRKMDPHVKVLISSGYSENGQAKEIIDEGVEGFVQKPVLLTELAEKIGNVLKKKSR